MSPVPNLASESRTVRAVPRRLDREERARYENGLQADDVGASGAIRANEGECSRLLRCSLLPAWSQCSERLAERRSSPSAGGLTRAPPVLTVCTVPAEFGVVFRQQDDGAPGQDGAGGVGDPAGDAAGASAAAG